MESDIKKMGFLMLALLSLVILTGITYLVADKYLDNLCDQEVSTAVYTGGTCAYENGTAVTDPESVNKTEIVLAGAGTVVGFVGIVVVAGIAKVLLRLSKSF